MYSFKNVVLDREHKVLISTAVNLERGNLGGYSIEIETNNPIAYESYLYKGRSAEDDREHDFKLLEDLLKKTTI